MIVRLFVYGVALCTVLFKVSMNYFYFKRPEDKEEARKDISWLARVAGTVLVAELLSMLNEHLIQSGI